jgi:hypothetical protein
MQPACAMSSDKHPLKTNHYTQERTMLVRNYVSIRTIS